MLQIWNDVVGMDEDLDVDDDDEEIVVGEGVFTVMLGRVAQALFGDGEGEDEMDGEGIRFHFLLKYPGEPFGSL